MKSRYVLAWMVSFLAFGSGGPAANADAPDDVTICVTTTVPVSAQACNAVVGEWSASGAIASGGSGIVSCARFNGIGVSVGISQSLIDDQGETLSVENETILDWQNLAECQVPEYNPCGLTCANLYNAREARWRFAGGTGPWANLEGEGYSTALINREYDGEGLCPGRTNQECGSRLCDAETGKCFRRVAHAYLSGRAHLRK